MTVSQEYKLIPKIKSEIMKSRENIGKFIHDTRYKKTTQEKMFLFTDNTNEMSSQQTS